MSGSDRRGKGHWADVAVASHRALRHFDDFIHPLLKQAGLGNMAVSNVIFLLSLDKGPKRVVDLIRDENIAGSNVSYAIASLVDSELAVRESDPKDKRVRVVTLTERGQNLAASIRRATSGDAGQIGAALKGVTHFENHCSTGMRRLAHAG